MTASTAHLVLMTRALRWSSPVLFNDPFDTPREIAFGVAPGDLATAFARRITSLIEDPPKDTSNLQPKLQAIVAAAKRGLPPDLKAEIREALSSGPLPTSSTALDELRALWRSFIPDFRMLCLTEDPASASMWHHYAGGLSGVVLELECIEHRDSAWFAARPVTYATRAADMFNADELAEIFLMHEQKARAAILDLGTFRKAPEWSYEREWRVVTSRRPWDAGHFTDYPFHPEEVAAIYLGPRIDHSGREALISAARSLPRARVVQVEIGMGQSFTFTEVAG
jgi:hypothetical protein